MESIKATVDIEMGTTKDVSKTDTLGENRIKPRTNETKDQSINGLTEIIIEKNNQIEEKCSNENKANLVNRTKEINPEDSETNDLLVKTETFIWKNKYESVHNEKPEEIMVSVPLCDINTVFTDVKIKNAKDINQTREDPIVVVVVNEIANGTNENSVHVYNNLNRIETDPNNPTGNTENENGEPQEENNNIADPNVNNTVVLDRNGTNSNENLEEVMDNLRTYMLDDEINVSNRMNRNLYYCDLFIHGSYLLTVLVLGIALAVDFSKESISRNETYMKCQCAILLLVLFANICMKIHVVSRLLKKLETPRSFKIFESYFHGFAMILSLFCLYIYVFHSETYPVSATFASAIIVALVYYFTSVVLFILLRIFLLLFILVIIIARRKTPTPKRILRKLKILSYADLKIFCEEGKFLKDNYFYIEEKEKEEDGKSKKEIEQEKEEENEGENKGESESPERESNKQHRINVDEEEKEEINKGNVDKCSNSTNLQPRFLGKRKDTTRKVTENEGTLQKGIQEEGKEKVENDLKRNEKIIDIKVETENNKFQDMKEETIESNGNKKVHQIDQRNNSEQTNNYYNRSTIAEDEEKNEVVPMRGIMHFIKTLLKRRHMKKEMDVKFSEKIDESYVHIDIENINLACSICCVEYLNDDEVCVLPCNYLHFFHKKCVFTWLKKNNECPFCRKNVESLFKKKRKWGRKKRTISK